MRVLRNALSVVILILGLLVIGFGQRSDPKVEKFAEELIQTESSDKRHELLGAQKELVTPELRQELVKQGNLLLVAGRYATALDVYGVAESVARQINDVDGQASASLNIGTVHYFQGDHQVALQHYVRARTLFLSVRNHFEAANALSGIALIYKDLGQNNEALKEYEQSLKEFESLGDKEEMAKTLGSLAAIYFTRGQHQKAAEALLRSGGLNDSAENLAHVASEFYRNRDYKQASEYYLRALKEFETAYNPAGIVTSLGGVANSLYNLGNYDEALKYYQSNLKVQQDVHDESGAATSLQGMGNAYRAMGDLSSALENYLKSLTTVTQSRIEVSTATTLGSIGLVKAMQGELVEAKTYYTKSLEQFETTGDKTGMARMSALMGNLSYNQREYDSAIESYQKSLGLRREIGDRSGEADLLIGIGTVCLAQQKYDEGLGNYEKALALFDTLGNKAGIADAFTKIADAKLLAGNFDQALTTAERAIVPAQDSASFSTVWYSKLVAGKAQKALNLPALASPLFAQAISIVESLRFQPESGTTGSSRNNLLPYLAQLDLMIEQNKPGEAFDLAERAKILTLGNLLKKSHSRITKGMSPSEQTEERQLVDEVVSLDLQLEREMQSRTSDLTRVTSLINQLQQKRLALHQFRNKLYVRRPQLRVGRGEIFPVSLEKSVELIDDRRTALLEYVVTEQRVLLFVLTEDETDKRSPGAGGRSRRQEAGPHGRRQGVVLKVYQLDLNPRELVERVTRFYSLLVNRDDSFAQPARELYDLLLRPAEEQLATKRNLIIVPDGILWRLPFEALQVADGRYLFDQTSTSYVPSLSALSEMRKRGERAPIRSQPTGLVAFTNPELPERILQRLEAAHRPEQIGSATEHQSEAEALQRVYGEAQSRIYKAAGATEERAKADSYRYGVLHFATPASLDDSSPMYSFIALSQGNTSQNDGLLYCWETFNLQSRAKVIVLSDASVRRQAGGAGNAVINMSWCWFVAGTPATVLSRWRIESPSVTQLMGEFHAGLKLKSRSVNKASKSDALRQAALKLRQSSEYSHPYYWSGFALLGDGR